jgi:hypothetical protein
MMHKVLGRGGGAAPLLPFTDTFDRADGDLGNGWQYTAGKWKIATNAAKGTPGLGAELLTDGGLENWINPTNLTSWAETLAGTCTVNREGTEIHGGTYAARLDVDASNNTCQADQVIANSIGDWIQLNYWMRSSASGKTGKVWVGAAGAVDNRNPGTSYVNYVDVIRAVAANASVSLARRLAASASIYFDDVSAKKITLADMFATRNMGNANVDISVPLTVAAGTRSGIVLCLDSVVTPANFIVANHDGTSAMLTNCVGGTYTSLISSAAAYADGRILRVVKSGNNVDLYYNGVQIGTTQAVADAGITNNTRHGMFSTYSGNTLASFTAV